MSLNTQTSAGRADYLIPISVVTPDGNERVIEAPAGGSLMQAIRDSGVDDLPAICGGCLSCATCHVWIEDATGLPPQGEIENELLESSDHRTSASRLSCQIPVSHALTGVRVTIAPQN